MESVDSILYDQHAGKIQDYTIIKEILKDDDAHTYPLFLASCQSRSDPNTILFAIKAIPVLDNRDSFQNEIAVSKLKPHPNILNCVEVIEKIQLNFGKFGTKRYNLLVYPYKTNGDLFEVVKQMRFDEQMIRYYIEQILNAVEYLHRNGLAHRDIKPDNILLDDNCKLVLTDFGFAVNHSNRNGPRVFDGLTAVTSIGICPPEYHKGAGYQGIAMDLFAIGKLLLTMATGINPFLKANSKDLLFATVEEEKWETFWTNILRYAQRRWINDISLSMEFKELIQGLLNPDPSKRWSIAQIRESSWFEKTKAKDFYEIQSSIQRAILLRAR